MPNTKTRDSRPTAAVYDEAARQRARKAFQASVQAMIADPRPLAALGELDDIEMMEAATELTRKR